MSTTKGALYLGRLEQARIYGHWESVPELARKVIKHAPGRKCLALTATAEAKIHQLLPPPVPHESPSTIVSYLVSLDALQDSLQQELDKAPSAATRLPSPAGGGPSPVTTPDDIVETRVTIAWACMLKGEWAEVARIVPDAREVSEEFVGTGGAKDCYVQVARIKALVLQGIALAHTNPSDLTAPLQLYRTAIRQATILPAQLRASPSTAEWTERALAHAALTAFRCWAETNCPEIPAPPATVCSVTPRKHEEPRGEWKTDSEQVTPARTPTITVEDAESIHGAPQMDEGTVSSAFKAFHRFITELPGVKIPTITDPGRGSGRIRDEERREVYRHHFRFLSVLMRPQGPWPRILPSESSVELSPAPPLQIRNELALVQGIYEAFLLHTHSFPAADTFHRPIGEFVDLVYQNWRVAGASVNEAEAVCEVLYRAATRTFHSPRILRHLFYVLAAIGNLTDAVRALETYLSLSENAAERISKGKIEKDVDDPSMVLTTAVDGIRLLTKYLGQGSKALKIAGKCELWVREWKVKDTLVLGAVYRGIGTANAAWARQTNMGEDRTAILQFAKKAFEKSIKHTPADTDAHYGLSIVHADLCDPVSATKHLRKALKRCPPDRGRKATIGHALAVLLSAQDEFEEAAKVCSKAITLLSPTDSSALSAEQKALAVELQMVRIALVEAVQGPGMAADGVETLLAVYTRLFPPVLGPPPRFETEDQTVKSRRPSTASRISRIFTLKPNYEKQYSSSANDLTTAAEAAEPQGCLPPTRPGTGRTDSGLSQSVRVRQRSVKMPKVRVATVEPGIPPSLAEIQAEERTRKGRRYSISGGTIRRARSVKSTYSVCPMEEEVPPLPGTGTETQSASPATPATPSSSGSASAGTGGDDKGGGMVNTLKRRLMLSGTFSSPSASSFTPSRNGTSATFTSASGMYTPKTTTATTPVAGTGTVTPVSVYDESLLPRALPLPPPAEVVRLSLVEPMMPERADDILRSVWLCIAGLYRRAGNEGDARDAVEEAAQVSFDPSRPNSVSVTLPMHTATAFSAHTSTTLSHASTTLSGPAPSVGSVGSSSGLVSSAASEDGFPAPVGTWGNTGTHIHAAIHVERGQQALFADDREAALRHFEAALAEDDGHPGATVGLCSILLGPESPPSSPTIRARMSDRELEEERVMKTARAARAVTLLRSCSERRGWGDSEVWWWFAEGLGRDGDVAGAKKALWRVVGLGDGGEGVRGVWAGSEGRGRGVL